MLAVPAMGAPEPGVEEEHYLDDCGDGDADGGEVGECSAGVHRILRLIASVLALRESRPWW